jgi:uncharacterized membrane protein HdeD (DUF308 family)
MHERGFPMTAIHEHDLSRLLRHELHVLQGHWGWYLALGICLIVLGFLAVGSAFAFTLATMTVISVLLIIGGISQLIGAFWARRWSGFFAELLAGILYLVVGFLTLGHPVASAAALTLVLAVFLIVEGIFRIVAAVSVRFPRWGWLLANGIIDVLLGVLIWEQWPSSSLWVIGLFIGLEMIFTGWTWVMLSLAVRSMPPGLTSKSETGLAAG